MTGDPVVRIGSRTIPHAVLKDRAARAAAAMRDAGVKHGDRIAIVLRNEPEFLMLSAAAGLIGAVPVPANWHWHGEELRHLLTHSGSRAAFAHSDLVPAVAEVLPTGVLLVEVPVSDELEHVYGGAPPTGDHVMLDDWLAGAVPDVEPLERAPLSLIYTSGTTGLPKGVLRAPMEPDQSKQVATASLRAMGLEPGMSTLITAPLYHAAPNAQGLFAMALGIDITIMPRFDPEEFLRLISEQRISHAQTVPTMFVRLLELSDLARSRYDISSLEAVVHAAAPCPAHVKRRMIEWFGPIILEYYGSTEVGVVVACDSEQWLTHEGTVGRPIGDADIRVFDDAGKLLPAGETGEIYLKPPSFWPGFDYLGLHEAREEVDRDGYVTIGDVGHVDADDFLYLSDRARDMVISGGVNIYPVEIEACLLEIAGVRDCAVFGIPDETLGEVVAAHVDADPAAGLTEAAIVEHVRSRLAGYKVPRVVAFDDALPREASGKIFKRRIRDRYWADAGRTI